MGGGECSDDEESVINFSDDEDFDSPDGEKIIQLMKNGMLTSELQVLYGLCLLSEDKFTFLATKMVNAMKDLENSNDEDFELSSHGISDDISLRLFRRAMAEPMNKLDAFAFTSDVLKKTGKEEEWAERLLPIFQDYMEELEQENAFHILSESAAAQTICMSMKRNSYLKVMFSTLRMKLSKTKKMAASQEASEKSSAYDLSMLVVDDIYRFQDAVWSMQSDGNPVPDSIEVISYLYITFTEENSLKLTLSHCCAY